MKTYPCREDLTVEEAKKMFTECSAMKGSRCKLLKAHFAMPDYTTTMTQLAKAVGYPNFNSANLQYGLFAKSMVNEMGWQHRFMVDEYTPYPLWSFVDFQKDSGEYWKLTLRKEAVEALKQLGW